MSGDDKVRFTSGILPRYIRLSKSIEELFPWLYLKGSSTGNFGEALAALLAPEAGGRDRCRSPRARRGVAYDPSLSYSSPSGGGASHGSSTPSTGNSRPNVRSHNDCFSSTPDSGRG